MKVLVVSGFLGAGKTTFIQEFAKNTDKKFTVMENEYSEIGVDADILKSNGMQVWEITEGCICCSLEANFATSILTIANSVNPDYLIVEPSGVAMLSSVIKNICKIEYEQIKLLEPVTIVDIECLNDYLTIFKSVYIDQIKSASWILISKTEDKTHTEIIDAEAILYELNPTAEIVGKTYSLKSKDWWDNILNSFYTKVENNANTDLKMTQLTTNTIPPNLETFSLENIYASSLQELIFKLARIIRKDFGYIYRAKGYVKASGEWLKFDIVNNVYNVEDCEPMNESKATFIGKALNRKSLTELFK